MSRPLRIEYPGALYHIFIRGNSGNPIFTSDKDRELFLKILGNTIIRYRWICHAYCLMNTHYHLLLETPLANLSKGMRHLNGVYTQKYNNINNHLGHLFQGRYKSILVEKDNYLLAVSRYIILNPVKSNLVDNPKDYYWSSARFNFGLEKSPA